MVHPSSDPEPYAISDEAFDHPDLPGATKVVVEVSADLLYDRIAADMVVQARECVREFGDFHLALSGGSTPQPLYERLMYDPQYRMLPWRRTHLWMVDERRVQFNDPESNFGRISEIIVEHADIPQEQVHPIFAVSDTADEDYERELREHLMWREKGQDRLDFVLLGMGTDGHTASLFADSEAIHEDTRFMRINRGGRTPSGGRVTMTFPLINAARFVAVLVCGPDKADAVARLAAGKEHVEALPIKGVQPVAGELHWYLDLDATGV